ncbi:MAG: carboxypeptidase regulatory-like domain-containing protein, partial [Blastocatellia bacterium]|nr:carboxypeptidase regulatory-like domain-containing protein [Blastocatellia bacterium]
MKPKYKSNYNYLEIYLITYIGRLVLLFTIVIPPYLLSIESQAQTITATITGTIRDPADAIVPNAKVVATAESTGNSKTAVTDDQGRYTLSFLQPGVYKISVEVSGFKTLTRSGITLEVAQVLTLDHKLEVGATQEIVQVTGETPLLITESAGLESTVENKLIEDLPSA